jgi:lysyl-tRNA synthetase class 2
MLEYYSLNASYLDSLEITEELFGELRAAAHFSPPFIRLTVEEAFWRWAGFDLFKAALSPGLMEEEARKLGLKPPPGLGIAELFDLIFVHSVEEHLKMEKPVVLLDYPAFVPCLAKKKPDEKTVERWELYACGIELANCFSEEVNAGPVRSFFESERAKKEQNALVRHNVDENYWRIFEPKGGSSQGQSFPPFSGVAMGLDRLIMLLCGKSSIDAVLLFPDFFFGERADNKNAVL